MEQIDAPPLSSEQLQEARLARRCFSGFERLMGLLQTYPPGHPNIDAAANTAQEHFNELFSLTDKLSVQVQPHELTLMGTQEEVWSTEEPRDYCFIMSRDGLFLMHVLAGIDLPELKRLASVFNTMIERRDDRTFDVSSALFEANLNYISYDVLDESMAALAGIDLDMRNRDTKEEMALIDNLFNKATGEDVSNARTNVTTHQIRTKGSASTIRGADVSSRHFLSLSVDIQLTLNLLKEGFIQHRELEHRQGEMLSAILGAQPKAELQTQTVIQIGHVMSQLLSTQQPWEALTFLKIIHQWRDKFAPEISDALKNIVTQAFEHSTIHQLVRQCVEANQKPRRMILQMFNALHLESASEALAQTLMWDINEEAREDIVRYLKTRIQHGVDFLYPLVQDMPPEAAAPIFELLADAMPASRDMLVELLGKPKTPDLKLMALKIVDSQWTDASELRDVLAPLLQSTHHDLSAEAMRQMAQAAPQHLYRASEQLFDDGLRKREDVQVREMTLLFVKYGGDAAVAKLKGIVQRRGVATSEAERELAISIARALLLSSDPAVLSMLEGVAKDWRVPKQIRTVCDEVVNMMKIGR